MKTEWVMTKQGTYMQIFVPDFEGWQHREPPTEEEMIEASQRYIYARYVENHPEEYDEDEAISAWECEGGAIVDDES